MIRVRFHGRGGHGIKTASRILGAAAFRAGKEVQDSPIYGAERRGAPVTAFTRISDETIRERGVIAEPDLIIIGDETLLADPSAMVLGGQTTASVVFLNTAKAASVASEHGIETPVNGLDLTALTRASLGRASALSVGLGAVSSRLVGCVELPDLLGAVEDELAPMELGADALERNLSLAREVFGKLQPAELSPNEVTGTERMRQVGYDGVLAGSPSILKTGNSDIRHTGSWRLERPEIDRDSCTRCELCFALCPDGAITLDEEGYPIIDYEHCKGCMICQHLCPIRAIKPEQEVHAW